LREALLFIFLFLSWTLLSRKWEIDFKVSMPWILLMGILSVVVFRVTDGVLEKDTSLLFRVIASYCPPALITLCVVLILFYRDPERVPPSGKNLVISPADGKILYIREIRNGRFPFSTKKGKEIPLSEFTNSDCFDGNMVQIGIGMNLLNVHVNRAPIGGKITLLKKVSGKFSSLKNLDSLLENERTVTVIDNDKFRIGMVQIASRLVRRITTFVESGSRVEIGQRIGLIHFGSQVDLLIPLYESLRVMIKEGQKVKAAESVIATIDFTGHTLDEAGN
jgi:phosphatidylserine decarboxylase